VEEGEGEGEGEVEEDDGDKNGEDDEDEDEEDDQKQVQGDDEDEGEDELAKKGGSKIDIILRRGGGNCAAEARLAIEREEKSMRSETYSNYQELLAACVNEQCHRQGIYTHLVDINDNMGIYWVQRLIRIAIKQELPDIPLTLLPVLPRQVWVLGE